MNTCNSYWQCIRNDLICISTPEKAAASRRYFPAGINCLGATAQDIKSIIYNFQTEYKHITADEILEISEYILINAEFNEEKLIAFGLINKFVKNNYDDNLLQRFEFWLETYANNWSLVDDLCIKTIYLFLMARPHLIGQTHHWVYSNISWCRRASNVVLVKFIKRKIGKTIFNLNKSLVFTQCDILLKDKDEFVQKSVGWLLKVTSVHHQNDVSNFIMLNIESFKRSTLRYAIEKMDAVTKEKLLSLPIK